MLKFALVNMCVMMPVIVIALLPINILILNYVNAIVLLKRKLFLKQINYEKGSNMNGVSIKYNFHEDVRIWALKFLKEKFDYDFSDKKNTNPALKDILTTLVAISHKQIPPQCYKIEFSQEFAWPQDPEEK